ncbi:sulfatase family protein [Marinilabilia rubra]|uniref:Arylsulfatase n=1 Tax=Marinilabilia rubra TaxID=2162893 RepID=A0A2U2B658_9BACT|nr:sulfatase [Marinilabilia rubra]PWD98536.1 arylsulfatase [Marinilabilia rubra]
MIERIFFFFVSLIGVSAGIDLHATGTFDNNSSPNVIIIFTDDLGYGDLSCYGHPTIRTPRLDKMADEGMRFTQFYVAAPVCTPSRAGLLTGRYPVRTGLVQGIMKGRVLFPNNDNGLPHEEVTIAEVLKQRDYTTKAVGKWHLGHLPEYLPMAQGFDGYYGIPYSNDMDYVPAKDGKQGYWNVPLMRNEEIIERPADQHTLTERYTEEAVKFIRENKDRPFFLYLAHSMPHIPLFASKDFEGISRRGLYGDVLEEIDWSAGEVLKTLEELGLDENTLVIFTSDNGPWLVQKENGGSAGLLREGKGTSWEGGHRVPMIARWPEHIPEGVVNENVATTLDLLPTIASLADVSLPEKLLDGENILPLLKGNKVSSHDPFMFYRGNLVFAVRMGKWKAHYITQTSYPSGPLNYHNPPLLYDLEHDPSEKINLAKGHPEIIEKITALKEAHEKTVRTIRTPEIEAENLMDKSMVTGGRLRIQEMPSKKKQWGNNAQLWWVEARPGDRLNLPLELKQSGSYELIGFFTRAGDYGIIRLHVNGKPVGPLVDGYNNGIEPTGPVKFDNVELKKGINKLVIELIGKDSRSAGYSDGYLVGIDGFTLKK